MAALPQEEVGAAAEAEEGEEEEEEDAGRRCSTCRRRSDQGRPRHRLGELPPQDGPQHPGHAVADRAGGSKPLSPSPSTSCFSVKKNPERKRINTPFFAEVGSNEVQILYYCAKVHFSGICTLHQYFFF